MLQVVMHSRVIQIEPLAPAKPDLGEPCNGCGICCLAEPCPMGILLTGRRSGACELLRWAPDKGLYRCGALSEPAAVVASRLPVLLAGLTPVLATALPAIARRWIASGTGCDCSLGVMKPDKGAV